IGPVNWFGLNNPTGPLYLNGPVLFLKCILILPNIPSFVHFERHVSGACEVLKPFRACDFPSFCVAMDGARKKLGYVWAISAGLNAAFAAISAKYFTYQFVKYGLVVLFNVTMWGCYVSSLKALSSLQATVTNFAANFLSSGLAGFFLFEEALPIQWFAGAFLIVIGVVILSKSSIERKASID
ncbi:hypothetical protein Tsubulata_036842, partial [Turnera subulata]